MMYTIIPVKKCKVVDCYRVDLYYDHDEKREGEYCMEHAKEKGLIETTTMGKYVSLCKSGTCINRVLTSRDGKSYSKYCGDHSVIEYHNKYCECDTKYTHCSDVKHLQCMFSKCVEIPHRVLYSIDRRGYYCIEHWNRLLDNLHAPKTTVERSLVCNKLAVMKLTRYLGDSSGLYRGECTPLYPQKHTHTGSDNTSPLKGKYSDNYKEGYTGSRSKRPSSPHRTSPNGLDEYIPDSDDWIEYALENISFCT